jgi:hypothetical protein
MLQQAHSLLIDELGDHIGQDGAECAEALVRLADVLQAKVIEQDLLDDEYGHSLAELTAGLHDTQAQGDDLGR